MSVKGKGRAVVLCCLLLLPFVLSACGGPSESEAIARLSELLPRSLAIEEAVWGDGLPIDGEYNPALEGTQYHPVSADAAFPTSAAFLAELAQVYTVERAEEILKLAFAGDGESDPRYKEEDGVLYMDAAYRGIALGKDIDLENARVTASSPYRVEIEASVRHADGSVGTKTFALANVDGVWLLDAPTYYRFAHRRCI